MARRERVPVEELVDPGRLVAHGRPLPPSQVRRLLPRGWALDADGRHAHRDARLLFREGWILLLGLGIFGALGALFLWGALPRGGAGLLRLALLVGIVLLAGGILGPMITRALHRR